MKKIIAATLATGLLALSAGAVFAAKNGYVDTIVVQQPGTGIKHTVHDLSTGTYHNPADTQNRICIYCHAPHHTIKPEVAEASRNVLYVPLWNHEITAMNYDMYSNGSDDPTDVAHSSYAERMSDVNDVGSVSRLCLSCHDGSIAANQYGYAPSGSRDPGTDNGKVTGSQYQIGGDQGLGIGGLQNHHPVGFDYAKTIEDESVAGRGEIAAADTLMGDYMISELLWGGNMECSTCHDVHNSQNDGEKFLWISDNGSALCLTCHLK